MQYYYKQCITPTCYNSNGFRKREWLHSRGKIIELYFVTQYYTVCHSMNIVRHHTSIKCLLKVFKHVFFCKETEMHNWFYEFFTKEKKLTCLTNLIPKIICCRLHLTKTLVLSILSCSLEWGGPEGGEEEAGNQRKRDQKWTSVSYVSHTSVTVRVVGCGGQQKMWREVCGSTPEEGQRGLGISPILSR